MRNGLRAVAFLGLFGALLRGASAKEAEAPASDEPMAEHAPKVASYTMRATLDPDAHTVKGEGTLTWTNPTAVAVKELWFHLYLNAFKNQASVFMRAPVGGFRGTAVPDAWGTIDVHKLVWVDGTQRYDLKTLLELKRAGDEDETDARVTLPRDVLPGQTITLEMAWEDKLPTVVERTGYDATFHMVGQWFPKIAKIEPDGTFEHFPFHHLGEFYADYGSYDVTIDVPAAYVVGATGPLVEQKTENGRRIERHTQEDVHDFAWTAWDKFQSRKEVIDGVDVTILYPPRYDDHAERELDSMRFALPHFGARYGKYPYKVLTLVHPPATANEAGGMEYPTLITTGGASWVPSGLYLPELVTVHEFGHQYFYGLLASNEVKWPFLDEGLNSYAEIGAMNAYKGSASVADVFGIRFGIAETSAERSRHFERDEKVAQPAWAFRTGAAYGALVYSRTATIMETLRRVYGDDKMRHAMGTYTRRFRFRNPTPDDFIKTMEAELGASAAKNLRAALFDKAGVDYVVTQVSARPARKPAGIFDRDGKRETVPVEKDKEGAYDGWVLVTRRGELTFPVEIELVFGDGTSKRIAWDGEGDSTRVPYTHDSPLRAAVVDPDSRVLLDEHPDNNFGAPYGGTPGGAPRTLERSTFIAEILLGAFAP